MKVDLFVTLSGIRLQNPFMNASGVYGADLNELSMTAQAKTGAIVYKTVTPLARDGNPAPRYWHSNDFALNSMGLPNLGLEKVLSFVSELKKFNKPQMVSVLGFNLDEVVKLVQAFDKTSAEFIEVNFSCPNIVGKPQAAYDFEYLDKLMSVCRTATKKPLLAKLPAYLDPAQRKMVADLLIKHKFNAAVLINSIGNSLAINLQTEKTIIRPNQGLAGLTGKYIKPIALGNVWGFYNLLKGSNVQIIGVGGIESGQDVFEFILAGADCVQIGTAYIKQGAPVFEKIEKELVQIMEQKGYTNLSEFKGKLKTWE